MTISPESQSILLPFLFTVLLGFFVWLYMFFVRFKAITAAKIDAADLATPDDVKNMLPDNVQHPSNNLKNLFEIPVLFMFMCLYLAITDNVDGTYLTLAWVFVGFRYAHSIVHCTYNNVMHRFAVYAVSCLALWVMLIRSLLNYL